ncbi:MAG: tRNA (adenosine(37)-N6)-threonylcarbamoyltransferase complex ATPase subunit type 1 TsaE [Ignavibacteriales bacterium]|nr:tRNA (adenosine(37)-N6)-threonylcarbamoyltransferase complex ATPase subunit type 1 TsaE [Ignavibacteriales bacterium]
MEKIVSHSESETIGAGSSFANRLRPGDVVALYGDLGSGKTRFVKGISLGLGIKEHVTSPTFVVVNEHRGGRIPLYHFDFYRLRSIGELREIGFDEYVEGNGICVFEWAEMISQQLPAKRYDVHLTLGETEMSRIITIEQR